MTNETNTNTIVTTNTNTDALILKTGNAAIRAQFETQYAGKTVDSKKFNIDKFLVPTDYEASDRFRAFFDHMHSNVVLVDKKRKLIWSLRQRKITLYVLNNIYVTVKKITIDNILNVSGRGLDLTAFIDGMDRKLVKTKTELQKPVSDALMVNITMNIRSLLRNIESENKTLEMVVGSIKKRVEETKTVKILEQALTFSGKYLLGEIFPGVVMEDVTIDVNSVLNNEEPVVFTEQHYGKMTETVYATRTRKTKVVAPPITVDVGLDVDTTSQTNAINDTTVIDMDEETPQVAVVSPVVSTGPAVVETLVEEKEMSVDPADAVSGTIDLALDSLEDFEIDDED